MFTELFPIVATTDMSRALGFYRDLLGGLVNYEFPGHRPTSRRFGLRRTKAARRGAAFDLVCVVAGDGFEPPTFGL